MTAKVRMDDGREFDMAQKVSLAETAWIERQSGHRMTEWQDSETLCAAIVATLRRNGVMVGWKDVFEDAAGTYEVIDEPDPTVTAQTGPGNGSTNVEAPTSSPSPTISGSDPWMSTP
jgi:hypothetical protein